MSSDPHDSIRRLDYRVARIAAAGALIVLLFVLAIADVISPDYALSEVALAALLGTLVTLLGIEAASVIRGSGK